MACGLSPHVAAAVSAAVTSGASRQVVAAVAAAAVRAAQADLPCDEDEVKEEVDARMHAITPVLREQVAAGREGRQARVPGNTRVKRNIAVHAGFGEGPAVVEGSAKELRRRQRGGRRRVDCDRSSGGTSGQVSTGSGEMSTCAAENIESVSMECAAQDISDCAFVHRLADCERMLSDVMEQMRVLESAMRGSVCIPVRPDEVHSAISHIAAMRACGAFVCEHPAVPTNSGPAAGADTSEAGSVAAGIEAKSVDVGENLDAAADVTADSHSPVVLPRPTPVDACPCAHTTEAGLTEGSSDGAALCTVARDALCATPVPHAEVGQLDVHDVSVTNADASSDVSTFVVSAGQRDVGSDVVGCVVDAGVVPEHREGAGSGVEAAAAAPACYGGMSVAAILAAEGCSGDTISWFLARSQQLLPHHGEHP